MKHVQMGSVYLLSILICINYAIALEREMTVNIDPGNEDCFFQDMKSGEYIDIEYQVIDGGHGELDIIFHLVDPESRILLADYKKSENNHRIKALMNGDYKFCFDNTFSSYNAKTVFFELIIETDEDTADWAFDPEELNNEITIKDVQEVISSVKNHLNKVRHFQDTIKSSEARDRNVMEEIYFFINAYSLVQLLVMIIVGSTQVLMIRSLFDDSSKIHKVWKKLDR